MPQPATKLVEITDEILRLASKDTLTSQLSEFEVQKISRLVTDLKQIDMAFYFSFLGVFYALTGKGEESIVNHRKAIERQPMNMVIRSNYGASLLRLKQYAEAKEQFMAVYDFNKSDPSSLSNAIIAAYYADDMEILPNLLDAFKKLTLQPHEAETWMEEDAHDNSMLEEYEKESREGPFVSLDDLKKELGL